MSLENEARLYWRTAKAARDATDEDDKEDAQDELEVLAECTESPRLKRLCMSAAARTAPLRDVGVG